jgi:hypothetical protein
MAHKIFRTEGCQQWKLTSNRPLPYGWFTLNYPKTGVNTLARRISHCERIYVTNIHRFMGAVDIKLFGGNSAPTIPRKNM